MKLLTFSNYILESAEPNNSKVDIDQLKSTLTELNYLLSIFIHSYFNLYELKHVFNYKYLLSIIYKYIITKNIDIF